MAKIRVTDRQGVVHDVDARAGERLMFVLRDDAGLEVEGLCGGCMVCGTCHVYLDPGWVDRVPAAASEERDMLESLGRFNPERSRLSCQIEMSEALEGLTLTLAPEE